MKVVVDFLRENAVWLHSVLIEYKLLYFDLWSIVHLSTGALLFGVISSLGIKNRWKLLFYLLVGFELFEATIAIGVLKLFMPEKIPDVFIDVIVGMLGGYLVYYIFLSLELAQHIKDFILNIISAAVIAFFWTGYYGYNLNIAHGDSTSLNLIAFLFWWIVGVLVSMGFGYLNIKLTNKFYSLSLVIILFIVLSIPFSYLIIDVFGVRDLSIGLNGSVAGVFHYMKSSFTFHILFPTLIILLNIWLAHLERKMILYENLYAVKKQ